MEMIRFHKVTMMIRFRSGKQIWVDKAKEQRDY